MVLTTGLPTDFGLRIAQTVFTLDGDTAVLSPESRRLLNIFAKTPPHSFSAVLCLRTLCRCAAHRLLTS